MIGRLDFSGKGQKVQPDGTVVEFPIAPPQVLAHSGPRLKITIAHPPAIQEKLKQEGKDAPQKVVEALIDTGATSCVITPTIADELSLLHTGYINIGSVHDEQERPVYYGMILFPWGKAIISSMAACNLRGFDCIIGRDVMRHWLLIYSGVHGSLTICD